MWSTVVGVLGGMLGKVLGFFGGTIDWLMKYVGLASFFGLGQGRVIRKDLEKKVEIKDEQLKKASDRPRWHDVLTGKRGRK